MVEPGHRRCRDRIPHQQIDGERSGEWSHASSQQWDGSADHASSPRWPEHPYVHWWNQPTYCSHRAQQEPIVCALRLHSFAYYQIRTPEGYPGPPGRYSRRLHTRSRHHLTNSIVGLQLTPPQKKQSFRTGELHLPQIASINLSMTREYTKEVIYLLGVQPDSQAKRQPTIHPSPRAVNIVELVIKSRMTHLIRPDCCHDSTPLLLGGEPLHQNISASRHQHFRPQRTPNMKPLRFLNRGTWMKNHVVNNVGRVDHRCNIFATTVPEMFPQTKVHHTPS